MSVRIVVKKPQFSKWHIRAKSHPPSRRPGVLLVRCFTAGRLLVRRSPEGVWVSRSDRRSLENAVHACGRGFCWLYDLWVRSWIKYFRFFCLDCEWIKTPRESSCCWARVLKCGFFFVNLSLKAVICLLQSSLAVEEVEKEDWDDHNTEKSDDSEFLGGTDVTWVTVSYLLYSKEISLSEEWLPTRCYVFECPSVLQFIFARLWKRHVDCHWKNGNQ